MSTDKEPVMVEVFAGEMFEVTYIKGLLEADGIIAYLQNEQMSTIAPWYITAGGAGALRLFVAADDEASAIELINNSRE